MVLSGRGRGGGAGAGGRSTRSASAATDGETSATVTSAAPTTPGGARSIVADDPPRSAAAGGSGTGAVGGRDPRKGAGARFRLACSFRNRSRAKSSEVGGGPRDSVEGVATGTETSSALRRVDSGEPETGAPAAPGTAVVVVAVGRGPAVTTGMCAGASGGLPSRAAAGCVGEDVVPAAVGPVVAVVGEVAVRTRWGVALNSSRSEAAVGEGAARAEAGSLGVIIGALAKPWLRSETRSRAHRRTVRKPTVRLCGKEDK